MKKTGFLRCSAFVIACLMSMLCVIGMVSSETVFADEVKTYSTRTSIEKQGDNGFYYAWGTPEKYVLMFYGATSGGGKSWRGIEIYATVSGSALHPGNYWGSMVVWVANESGKVSLSGSMEKGTTQGDGVNLGVYHQHYGGKLETLFEKFVDGKGELKYPLEQEIEVKKGDSFIFYCDSGKAKDNPSDSCGCPFTITYTRNDGDASADEDLSKYLNVAQRPGDVGGFTHVEPDFAADNLDGVIVKTTTVTRSVPTVVYVIVSAAIGVLVAGLVVVALVRRNKK